MESNIESIWFVLPVSSMFSDKMFQKYIQYYSFKSGLGV